MFQRIIHGVTATANAHPCGGSKRMHISGDFGQGGGGSVLSGLTLDEDPFVGRPVLPARLGGDIGKLAVPEGLLDQPQRGAF
mgnify:CR=1 FL=1